MSGVEAMEMDEKRPNVADTLVDDVKVSMNLGSLMMKVIIRKRRMLSPHRYNTDWFKFSGETTTHIESTA